MQVIPSHFCCNLSKLPSFVHGTYIPKTNPSHGFCTRHFQLHASSFPLAFTTGSHTVRRPWKVCVQDIGCLRCFFRKKLFLQDKVVSLNPNPHAWKAVGLSLVWTLLLDLSGLGGPTRGVNTPAGIAFGVAGTHKPLSHDNATVPVSASAWAEQKKIVIRRLWGFKPHPIQIPYQML